MSSTNKTTNYQLSQFVGTDIPSILNDYNGDMRKIDSAIKEVSVAGGDNASEIAELRSTVGAHTTEISGINSTVNSLSGRVVSIESKIPDNASADNKLITYEDIPEIPSISELEDDVEQLQNNVANVRSNVVQLQTNVSNIQTNIGEMQEQIDDMGGDIKDIQLCVPSNASPSNQLATMDDIPSGGGGIEYKGTVTAEDNEDFGVFCARLVNFIDTNVNVGDHKQLKIQLTAPLTRRSALWFYLTDYDAVNKRFTFNSVNSSFENLVLYITPTSGANYMMSYRFEFANSYNYSDSSYNDGAVTGYTVTVGAGNTVDSATKASVYA